MSIATHKDRQIKKRRFFDLDSTELRDEPTPCVMDPPSAAEAPVTARPDANSELGSQERVTQNEQGIDTGFDSQFLGSLCGKELLQQEIQELKTLSRGDMERAVNLALDGVHIRRGVQPPKERKSQDSSGCESNQESAPSGTQSLMNSHGSKNAQALAGASETLYVGSFSAIGWATRSGTKLLKHGETIRIDRHMPKETGMKRGRSIHQTRHDIVVRFTNSENQEVGRLESETANWVSTLLDQRICAIKGSCIYCPEEIRSGETIVLELSCYFLKSTLSDDKIFKLQVNDKPHLFESKESTGERALRIRQVALQKLLEHTKLEPTNNYATAKKINQTGPPPASEVSYHKDSNSTSHGIRDTGLEEMGPGGGEQPEDGMELEQDQLDALYKRAQSFDFNLPESTPAETFAIPLRRYQKQALSWMLSKEHEAKCESGAKPMHPLWDEYLFPTKDKNGQKIAPGNPEKFYLNAYSGQLSLDFPVQDQKCRGGILADEMGLGKTVEMLSLIHSHRAETIANPPKPSPFDGLRTSWNSLGEALKTTLVVAPMSLLSQWHNEVAKASHPDTMKSIIYYGTDKNLNLRKICGRSNWEKAPDIIITSYGVVLSEHNCYTASEPNSQAHSGLFSVNYFRVILDEAHVIKNRSSKTSKACCDIQATHRWALTGTPIVNRLEDLFSLIKFLRVEPWSNFTFWNTFITKPFESKNFLRALDVVQVVLEPLVLRRTKDMKTPSGESLVNLPKRNIVIDYVELSRSEREVYDHILTRVKQTMDASMDAGTLMKSYTTIFAQILRLRQSCCHPVLARNRAIVSDLEQLAEASDALSGLQDDMDLEMLISRFTASAAQDANAFGAHALKQIQEEAQMECPICTDEPMTERSVTGCWHSACKNCLLEYIQSQIDRELEPKCFTCRQPINSRDVFQVLRHDDEIPTGSQSDSCQINSSQNPRISLRRVNSQSSTKISRLIDRLRKLRRSDPQSKSVVFSQFTSFLDLIEPALKLDRFNFVRLDGSLTQKHRASVLDEFHNRPEITVLLLSLRAGGVGLNLVCASRVFLMDPWWSFAVESQAIDRVHRMGQENEVFVTRFIARGTIEERILEVQDRKKFIAKSLGMMEDQDKKLQRIDDIKELLS